MTFSRPGLRQILTGALALTLASVAAASETPPATGTALPQGETGWRSIKHDELCVTHGTIEADSGGRLSVSNAEVRAVSRRGIARAAELRFTFLGPSAETSLLRSGQLRRQLGLKLRAQNGCNLVYVMWRIEPQN